MNSLSSEDTVNRYTALQGMKILFVFGSFDLGGAERQGVLLADFLKNRCRSDVRIWGLDQRPGRMADLCDQYGIPWQGIRFHWGLRRGVSHFFEFVARMREQRPDILISYTCVPHIVCALVWKLAGALLCVWNQADEGLLLNRGPLHRFAVKRPHCFISNSKGGKDFLVKNYGFGPEAIQMIRNGIPARNPIAGRTAWRKQLGLAPDSFVACMVANLSRHKDHVTLLKAWREVLDRSGDSRAVLVLAGRFDGTEKVLHHLCEELGIFDQVRFLGKVDDVDGLLDAVDLFAYSSRSEGVPNAVLEAMAAGLPVVATDIPGIREAAGPEGSGFLAPVGDHRAFADRILLFLHDDLLRRTSGAQLKARVESEFSIDRMCEETATLLCSALRKTEEM